MFWFSYDATFFFWFLFVGLLVSLICFLLELVFSLFLPFCYSILSPSFSLFFDPVIFSFFLSDHSPVFFLVCLQYYFLLLRFHLSVPFICFRFFFFSSYFSFFQRFLHSVSTFPSLPIDFPLLLPLSSHYASHICPLLSFFLHSFSFFLFSYFHFSFHFPLVPLIPLPFPSFVTLLFILLPVTFFLLFFFFLLGVPLLSHYPFRFTIFRFPSLFFSFWCLSFSFIPVFRSFPPFLPFTTLFFAFFLLILLSFPFVFHVFCFNISVFFSHSLPHSLPLFRSIP